MLVKEWMVKDIYTIDQESTIVDAMKIMKEKGVSTLPVTKKGKLIGIVTNGDIKKASPSDATLLDAHELAYAISGLKIKKVMSKPLVIIPEDKSIVEATEILLHRKVAGAPVVDKNNDIVGMISKTELTELLLSLSGAGAFGIEMGMIAKDEPGSIKELADIIRKYNGRIRSILTLYENAPEGYREIFFKIFQCKRESLDEMLEELSKKAKLKYMVDHLHSTRKFF
ncbi:MAG: CBS and ACT domain-containing protein [Desulfobacteraceae bacterium]